MPERSGLVLFMEDQFSKVAKLYDRTLAKVERDAEGTARAITKTGKAQSKSFADVGVALGGLAVKYAGAIGAAYSFQRVLGEAVDIASANQAAMQGLAMSTGVAQREFGSAVGTTAQWTARVRELSDELLIYSDTAVAQAIRRTVDMTKRLGLSEAQMVEVVRRAGDLGAGKTDLTGAVERVTAALRGEAESAEYLGLTLSETYVKTSAARLGFSKAWKDMTELEKAQVRYAAFLEQTNEVIGAAAASTETLAGAQAEARKEYERAAQQLGEALLPLKTELIGLEVDLIKVLGEAAETFKQLVALAHAGTAAVVEMAKGLGKGVVDVIKGQARPFEEVWAEAGAAGARKYEETILKYVPPAVEEAAAAAPPIIAAPEMEPPDYEAIAKAATSTFDAIGRMQHDHNLRLQREEEDAAKERARAWADYEKKVANAVKDGGKRLAKITASYEKDRAKIVADYQEHVAEVEDDGQKDRLKAQRDFERQARQSRERFQLSQLQSERRYQFERQRLVAEGDTLAIEELDARYKLEQKEATENEALRERQDRESQAARIREAGEAAREQLQEMEQQLGEQLAEQEAGYREQIETQRLANQERLAEMAADFAERQRVEDENRRIAIQRREEDYRYQLEELGASLADQLREHEYGADNVARLLEQYYGAGGLADQIMQGYHEREAQRIAITAGQLAAMGQAAPTMPTHLPMTGLPTAPMYGMQRGGVLAGPAHAFVEPGMVEAFVPLGKIGGTMQHNFGALDVNIHGLTGASQSDINIIASSLARELTSQIRTLRRS